MTIAVGRHLFPSRTQQLSPPAPMVLPWQRGGRVGHCRVSLFLFNPHPLGWPGSGGPPPPGTRRPAVACTIRTFRAEVVE